MPTHSKFVRIVVGIMIIAAAYYVITRIALSVLTSSRGRLVVSPVERSSRGPLPSNIQD
jgi:hypothetical protein